MCRYISWENERVISGRLFEVAGDEEAFLPVVLPGGALHGE